MKYRLAIILTLILALIGLAACRPARPTVAEAAEEMQPTIAALAVTRAALQTQSSIPTATVTPMAEVLTGGDALTTTLIWNITDNGLGAGGGIHELPATTEAHHYLFAGSAGDEVNIHVNPASPGSLPRFILLDPVGQVMGQAAASGPAQGAEITVILSSAGTYHIRVSAITPGKYALGMTLSRLP